MRFDIVSLTAGFAATASAQCVGNYFSFYNRAGNAMSYQRLDPGLFPGTESPHLHSFDGGNGLSKAMGFADTQASDCTTARVKTDKSLYWRPTLFFTNGTKFYRVPELSTKIYYKYGDGNNWANVTAYPEDFNMIAGSPLKRSDGDNPAGVRWGCHEPDGGSTAIFANGFPKGFSTCKYGFASEVTFPSCWNGEKMDPKNPSAHMAYPNGNAGIGIENCPTTHRAARFPTLFIEYWWDVTSFTFGPNEAPWILSNGDPTGYGFHGDFMNGWESGVLEKAVSENDGCKCGCGCGQAEMEQCFGSENVNKDSDESWASCSAMETYGGDDGSVLDALPGCNPIQSGPASATSASGLGCTAAPAPAGNSSATYSATVRPTSMAVISSAYGAAPSGAYSAALPHVSSGTSVVSEAATPLPMSAFPSYTAVLPEKQVDKPTGYDAAQPTLIASEAADATTCTSGATVTETVKATVTVTVDGHAAVSTGSY
ncbi:hypothetical protein ACET3X_009079 [Alternaria dauci]|uniref:DUF1996 domain-containing protein n=1 Tax=Alternaria dauci TaxID=48095 RepID=A0ABR3U8Z8_9PLEO